MNRLLSVVFIRPTRILIPLGILVAAMLLVLSQSQTRYTGMELQLDRFEQIGAEHMVNSTGMRVMKINRTTHAFNGTCAFLVDIDDSYEMTVKVARSLLGNQQFNEYPMKIPRMKACQVFNEYFPLYQHYWRNSSNLPVVERGKYTCPFPRGEYWLQNFAPDGSWIPPVVPEGYWRLSVYAWWNGEPVGHTSLYMHVRRVVRVL